MTLGQRIRYYRNQTNLSQEQLGKLIGVEPGVISNYENDKYKPSADTIVQLAKAFATSTDSLLLESVREKYSNMIEDEELAKVFLEVINFSSQEKEAIKTIIKAIALKNKSSNKIPVLS